ncbi:NAD(P)-binding protein [Glonium stellatum]|uniref:NAD(P)-binding protein n=1 Tax=Glonium stellatum TaxID=574774 RepID=A0A8E2JMH4_9PEZI|nr:NAD(P)-binding protein [Glonium stellatum]
MSVQQTLPTVHRALVQHVYAQTLVIEDVPTPQPVPGSAILRVEAAAVISYQRDIYNGNRQYPYLTPLVPGSWAIGRVVTWRDSSFAQFVKVPLENCHPLDEARLCNSPAVGGLGYTIDQLVWAGMALVGYGGLRSIELQAGETIIIASATGGFGGAATVVAVAMGACVIAMGRNTHALQCLEELSPRVHTVPISGNHDAELRALAQFGCADAFLDLSPPAATDSTHLKSAIRSLRKGGRVSLMGGPSGDVAFPYRELVFKDLTLKAQWMYDTVTARDMIKLMEAGILSFDHVKLAGKFALEQWEQAFEAAAGMKFDEVTVMSGW